MEGRRVGGAPAAGRGGRRGLARRLAPGRLAGAVRRDRVRLHAGQGLPGGGRVAQARPLDEGLLHDVGGGGGRRATTPTAATREMRDAAGAQAEHPPHRRPVRVDAVHEVRILLRAGAVAVLALLLAAAARRGAAAAGKEVGRQLAAHRPQEGAVHPGRVPVRAPLELDAELLAQHRRAVGGGAVVRGGHQHGADGKNGLHPTQRCCGRVLLLLRFLSAASGAAARDAPVLVIVVVRGGGGGVLVLLVAAQRGGVAAAESGRPARLGRGRRPLLGGLGDALDGVDEVVVWKGVCVCVWGGACRGERNARRRTPRLSNPRPPIPSPPPLTIACGRLAQAGPPRGRRRPAGATGRGGRGRAGRGGPVEGGLREHGGGGGGLCVWRGRKRGWREKERMRGERVGARELVCRAGAHFAPSSRRARPAGSCTTTLRRAPMRGGRVAGNRPSSSVGPGHERTRPHRRGAISKPSHTRRRRKKSKTHRALSRSGPPVWPGDQPEWASWGSGANAESKSGCCRQLGRTHARGECETFVREVRVPSFLSFGRGQKNRGKPRVREPPAPHTRTFPAPPAEDRPDPQGPASQHPGASGGVRGGRALVCFL